MALPASDNFNRAGPGLGANWTTLSGLAAPLIDASTVVRTNAVFSDSAAYWSADAFGNDHYAEVKVIAATTDNTRCVGVMVRAQAGGDCYAGYVLGPLGATATVEIRKRISGVGTVIATTTATVNANDVLRLTVTGSSLVLKIGSTTIHSISNSDIPSGGSAGIWVFTDTSPNTSAELDDFAADNAAAGGRTTKNSQAAPLGMELGLGIRTGLD